MSSGSVSSATTLSPDLPHTALPGTALTGTALPGTALTDRRAARRAQTERALRAAALDLAEERGFDRFTVDEVAARADVSPRTFFNYFATKEAAVLTDPRPVMEAMIAAVAGQPDLTLTDALHGAILAFLRVSTADERAVRRELALTEDQTCLRIAQQAQYSAYESALGNAIATRMGTSVEADPMPLALAAAAVGVSRVMLVRWSRTGEPAPSQADVAKILTDMGALLTL